MSDRREGNAIALAKTPNISALLERYPSSTLVSSGLSVGLPPGQMGNSEVGHLTLGAGRIIFQDLTRINSALADGAFRDHPVLNAEILNLKERGRALHIMGLLSDGGVHSHIDHLYAVIEVVKRCGLDKLYIHPFLDGRDTAPRIGAAYIKALEDFIARAGLGTIATVSGRYYAMDRDRRWDRLKRAYVALTEGHGMKASTAVEAVKEAYARGETDEFVRPTVITSDGKPTAFVRDGDGVLFINFRADRAREITAAFTDPDFTGFERKTRPELTAFVCMTEYDDAFDLPVLFPRKAVNNILGEVLSRSGIKQFRVSETEKYAHVTFFFNGGMEEPFEGETRLLIPSITDVPTYDIRPEMRAVEIADAAVGAVKSGDYGFILVNFANGDMVGHTGVIEAAIKACEEVDKSVGRLVEAARAGGWVAIVTSDHGNVEQMKDDGQDGPHTAHTCGLVPIIVVDDRMKGKELKKGGLSDVAPTVLKIMGIEVPPEMEGTPLL